MDIIKDEMLRIGADGVIFIPLTDPSINIWNGRITPYCEYNFDEWCQGVKSHPKSPRQYYKVTNGTKTYYDFELKEFR